MMKAVRVSLAALVLFVSASTLYAQKPGVGAWAFTTISPEGETKSTLVISEDGGKLKAVAKSERGERAYDSVEVAGNKITLVLTISYNGSPMTITYTGTIDKDKMSGEADFGGLATGSWSAAAQQ
jgi:hypothetical protein